MKATNDILDGLASIAESFEAKGRFDLASALDKAAYLLGANKQIVETSPFKEIVGSAQAQIINQISKLDSEHKVPFTASLIRDVEANLNQIHADLQVIKLNKNIVKRVAVLQSLALLVSNLAEDSD